MNTGIFLSQNTKDRPFVEKLARDLDNYRVSYWVNEAEIEVEDLLIEKIRSSLDKGDLMAAILFLNFVASSFQRKIDVAMNREVYDRKVEVLTIMY